MRSVPEWKGSNDDVAIPPHVKERIARRVEDKCQKCNRPVGGKLRAEFDHVIPLCIGGEHRETNLMLLCHECHGGKTKLDMKLKAKVSRIRKRHLGLRKPSKFACSRDSKWRKKLTGEVVPR